MLNLPVVSYARSFRCVCLLPPPSLFVCTAQSYCLPRTWAAFEAALAAASARAPSRGKPAQTAAAEAAPVDPKAAKAAAKKKGKK